MVDVDTIRSIKRLYSLLHISSGVFDSFNVPPERIWDELILPPACRKGNDPCPRVFESALAVDERLLARHDMYRLHEANLARDLSSLEGKVLVMMNGLALTEFGGRGKEWLDPFSNSCIPTSLLLQVAPGTVLHHAPDERAVFPKEVLDEYLFWPLSCVDFPMVFSDRNGPYGLECAVLDDTVWDGYSLADFRKADDFSDRLGLMRVSPDLFNPAVPSSWELVRTEFSRTGCKDAEEYLKYRQRETYLAKELLALKYGLLLGQLWPKCIDKLHEHGLRHVQVFAEKTSVAAHILRKAEKYALAMHDVPLTFEFVGGCKGPMATAKDPQGYTERGIAHPSSMERLFGIFQHRRRAISPDRVPAPARTRYSSQKQVIDYAPSEKYPFLLLEPEALHMRPNIEDVFEQCLSPIEQDLLARFARDRGVAYKRREPRTVEFFLADPSIYLGDRVTNKTNRKWQEEIRGFQIVFPHQLNIAWPTSSQVGDFRGSEFTIGSRVCPAEAIIGSLDPAKKTRFLEECVAGLSPSDRAAFLASHVPGSLDSIYAVTGTAAHKLSTSPLPGLAHYTTLQRIGVPPISSDTYAEVPFFMRVGGSAGDFSVSFHPDQFMFLKDGDTYHVVVIDIKNKRVTPYPEHHYRRQTFLYGALILRHLKDSGLNTGNIYTCLDRNPFDHLFFGVERASALPRPLGVQKFSPIIKYTPDHPFHEEVFRIAASMVQSKAALRNGEHDWSLHKSYRESEELCTKCYVESRYCCDALAILHNSGIDILPLIQKP